MNRDICSALLIDVAGKQDYIFSGNKLKENIGASYILSDQVFGDTLYDSISLFSGCDFEEAEALARAWEKENDIWFAKDQKLLVGYIGGGNALLLFNNFADLEIFIKEYSLSVLKAFPGVQLNFGCIDDFDKENFSQSRMRLNQSLRKNRNANFSIFRPFKSGIAIDCPLSGEGQEVFNPVFGVHVSRESDVRITHTKIASKKFEDRYDSIMEQDATSRYELTNEIEDLDSAEEKSYIAVVHIDGNGLGKKFKNTNTLAELRKLSGDVKNKLTASMEVLLDDLVKRCESSKGEQSFLSIKENKTTRTLPFRSIINAGDDITFVCQGKLGIYLAKRYMEILADSSVGGLPISSCAGVAIVNKKYPFFRAYKLSESLAGAAKQVSRGVGDEGTGFPSFINFHISAAGYTGDFEDLIHRKYSGNGHKELAHGPYILDEKEKYPGMKNSLADILERLDKMLYHDDPDQRWPGNKIFELRQLLSKDTAHIEYFKEEVKARNLKLEDDVFDFPYYDMTDLIEFYPKELMK